MKKMGFGVIPLVVVFLGCAGGAKAAESPVKPAGNNNSAGMDLDAAIREAAARMGQKLPGGTKVALVSVASSSAQLSEYVIGRLEAALVGGEKLVVVDRANLDKVRAEQGFHASGEVDDDSAKSIGKLLGAGAIVTGAFSDLGDVYSLTLKAINIETATVAVSYPADITKSARIETLLASGGGTAASRQTAQTGGRAAQAQQAAAPTPAAPPAPTYKIGDTGPAGGIVFYDKGNSSGGWRYLEAAPALLETTAAWGGNGTSVNTGIGIGNGNQNTTLIVKALKAEGQAAQYCDELVYGGYEDWFLPSNGELNLMYTNLKQSDLGGFKSEWYWSSSQVDYYEAWRQSFSSGSQNQYGHKFNAYLVRAVRQF